MPLAGSVANRQAYTNKLLRNMPEQAVAGLRLRPIRLDAGFQLESPGSAVKELIFPEAGIATMTTTFQDGCQVEAGLYGYDSVVGLSALMGTRQSLNRVYMQIAGHGYAARVADGRTEFLRGGTFQQLALACVQSHAVQVAQTAGCNARHDVEQRLARWLLNCADRTRSLSIPMSQECLATMIGVRRMSAVVGLARLKALHLIDHHRGELLICDLRGLEARSCECYRVVRAHLEKSEGVRRRRCLSRPGHLRMCSAQHAVGVTPPTRNLPL